jgi:hypothetical protein
MKDEKLIGLTLIKLNLTGWAIVTLYIYTNTSCDQIRYKPGAINLYNKTKITFRHVQPNAPLS